MKRKIRNAKDFGCNKKQILPKIVTLKKQLWYLIERKQTVNTVLAQKYFETIIEIKEP